MNVVVKFLVVSVPMFVPKSGRVGILEDFFFANKTFSNRFFMKNRKLDHLTTVFEGHVCNLHFTFERHEGLIAVGDLRQRFFATTNCTASLLKARRLTFFIRLRCFELE